MCVNSVQQRTRILSQVQLYQMKFPGESRDASISFEEGNDRTNPAAK